MRKPKEYSVFYRPEKRRWLKLNSYGNVNWKTFKPNEDKWIITDISIVVLKNCKIPFYKVLTGFNGGGRYYNPDFITIVPAGYTEAILCLYDLRKNGKKQTILFRPFTPTRKVLIEKTK